MKRLALALVSAVAVLFFLLGAGSSGSGSGLRGMVVLEPAFPTCKAGSPCSKPVRHAVLRFSRNGRLVAHTRSNILGRFRIALPPSTYAVSSTAGLGGLRPAHVTVTAGTYRRVTFKLDIGIR